MPGSVKSASSGAEEDIVSLAQLGGGGAESECDSLSDSPEADCVGCEAKSKDNCPVSVAQGKPVQIQWARERTRRYMRRGKRITRKIKTGAWCRHCFNFARTAFKPYLKDLGEFNEKVKNIREKFALWTSMRKNYMKKKIGGTAAARVRTAGVKKTIAKKREARCELIDPRKEFMTLSAYQKRYKSLPPKKKIRTVETKSGKTVKGVVVQVGEKGVYELKSYALTGVAMNEEVHGQDDSLHDRHAEDVFGFTRNEHSDLDDDGITDAQAIEHASLTGIAQRKNDESDDEDSPGAESQDEDDASSHTVNSESDADMSDAGRHTKASSSSVKQSSSSAKQSSRDRKACPTKPAAPSSVRSSGTSAGTVSRPPKAGKPQGSRGGPSKAEVTQGKLHVQSLTSVVDQFVSGELLSLPLRGVQAQVKNMKETLDTSKRFLKAWGKSALPADFSSLGGLVDEVEEIINFCKNSWPKMSSLNGAQALEAMERTVQALRLERAPLVVGKCVLQKLLDEADPVAAATLLSTTNKRGIGMLPPAEQESFVIKCLHKATSGNGLGPIL